jgi:hypothetical protein
MKGKAKKVEAPSTKKPKPVFWTGPVPFKDDFGQRVVDEFIDGVTKMGPWATMTPWSWERYGASKALGTGLGQRFKKQPDGMWLKVEG